MMKKSLGEKAESVVKNKESGYFTEAQKQEIFKRDDYSCVFCGLGTAEGIDIHAEAIEPKYQCGRAGIINGQTLCAQHNFQKKNYRQAEKGKRLFTRLLALAKKQRDGKTKKFCEEILEICEKNI
ncbi:MAG: HNH endonuclease [Candidatus Diapherotrites archaeon]|nr:HNH endonuclease [Candidatus Diapherotrites archaeon]